MNCLKHVKVIVEFTDCETPTIANAEAAEAPKGTTYGEVAILSCSTGYSLNGSTFVTCQTDGSWSTLPTCDIIGMHITALLPITALHCFTLVISMSHKQINLTFTLTSCDQ